MVSIVAVGIWNVIATSGDTTVDLSTWILSNLTVQAPADSDDDLIELPQSSADAAAAVAATEPALMPDMTGQDGDVPAEVAQSELL